ncbi:MAG: H-type small acid-soluble spore protein [Thermotaleaceae bacterium]
MQFVRAQQILSSENTISVHYQGSPIWIEKLDEHNQTALITAENRQMTVPIKELQEIH